MKIDKVYIKNFRSIRKAEISLKDLTILIGNNGTGKTTILEAINYALSPAYISGRIQPTDFFNGTDESIEIELLFSDTFIVGIPDGYHKQNVVCNKIHLDIKKRERAANNKSFSDGYVTNHYFVPEKERTNEQGWEQSYKNGKKFEFDERHLSINGNADASIPKGFYFGKNRSIQIKRGYNSSITNLFDDFNWRFAHNIAKNEDNYFNNAKSLKEQILSNIDDKTIDKSLTALNEKLRDFNIPEIDITLLDSHAPFNSAFLSNTIGDIDIGVDSLGSGVEMIIALMFLETLASLSKDEILIIIDEPELHLHPSLQEKFIQYLKSISSEKQIIISTHSPYFFKNCFSDKNIKLLITDNIDGESQIKDADYQLNTFEWSPSWGEINYFAYNLSTIEFHNELYGYCLELTETETVSGFEKYLSNINPIKAKKWKQKTKGGLIEYDLSLMSYIRNLIHHPENKHNEAYTIDELKISIQKMLRLIKIVKAKKQED